MFRVVDDPENGPIDWELSGTDRGDFTIDGGVLEFAPCPTHENAADSNRDNVYHVTVTVGDAFDGANRESLSVIVTVADLDEPGTVTLPSLQPQVGTALSRDAGRTRPRPDRPHLDLAQLREPVRPWDPDHWRRLADLHAGGRR